MAKKYQYVSESITLLNNEMQEQIAIMMAASDPAVLEARKITDEEWERFDAANKRVQALSQQIQDILAKAIKRLS